MLLAFVAIASQTGCERPLPGPSARGADPSLPNPVAPLALVSVTDGDTFEIRDAAGHTWRVRVAGIDAPERSQPYGREARAHLAELLSEGPLRLEVRKLDRYGRLVADAFAGASDAGRAMLKAGAAWHYRRYAHEQPPPQRRAYEAAERDARAALRGLWRQPSPEPPWAYRARRRTDS